MKQAPFPKNEMDRIITLSDYDLNFTDLSESFKDLAKLAAKVTGCPISMVNLIDNYTTWTVSSFGIDVQQTPREDSICQYTILEKDDFAVNDLTVNPIFKDEGFVTGDAHFRFYHGVPLSAHEHNLGALCVLDIKEKSLSAEKVEMLKIIATEVINRLNTMRYITSLRDKVAEVKNTQSKVVHDIRGPIAGIIGLASIINEQGKDNNLDEVLDFINMIYKGGRSVLDLADEILSEDRKEKTKNIASDAKLLAIKDRFEQLYTPQAISKNIIFSVELGNVAADVNLPQSKLMQIGGNLISNAMKFTPKNGKVTVTLETSGTEEEKKLKISVKDTGSGISQLQIDQLLAENSGSTDGTDGEKGFGFGLALVKHLVKGLNGTFSIKSAQEHGSTFEVVIPFE